MLVLFTLCLATLLSARWARRSGAGRVVFALGSFASGVGVYFLLLAEWIGGERLFNGASLEALGVLGVLAVSIAAAAVTTVVLTAILLRWRRDRPASD